MDDEKAQKTHVKNDILGLDQKVVKDFYSQWDIYHHPPRTFTARQKQQIDSQIDLGVGNKTLQQFVQTTHEDSCFPLRVTFNNQQWFGSVLEPNHLKKLKLKPNQTKP